jgi:hypothetical protein
MRGLSSGYAKINAEWIFPKADRRIHFISLADAKGGVAAITFLDTSPRKNAASGAAAGAPESGTSGGPNPGF